MKFKDLPQEHKQMLLQQPHQLFVVDELVSLNVGAFTSILTFANASPQGFPTVVCTINASTKDIYDIAKAIVTEIESKKPDLEKEILQFLK